MVRKQKVEIYPRDKKFKDPGSRINEEIAVGWTVEAICVAPETTSHTSSVYVTYYKYEASEND